MHSKNGIAVGGSSRDAVNDHLGNRCFIEIKKKKKRITAHKKASRTHTHTDKHSICRVKRGSQRPKREITAVKAGWGICERRIPSKAAAEKGQNIAVLHKITGRRRDQGWLKSYKTYLAEKLNYANDNKILHINTKEWTSNCWIFHTGHVANKRNEQEAE